MAKNSEKNEDKDREEFFKLWAEVGRIAYEPEELACFYFEQGRQSMRDEKAKRGR